MILNYHHLIRYLEVAYFTGLNTKCGMNEM